MLELVGLSISMVMGWDEMIDWLLSGLSIGGAILNARKNVYGFYLWIVSNIGWVAWDVMTESWGQIPFFAVCTIISAYGIICWNKKKSVREAC